MKNFTTHLLIAIAIMMTLASLASAQIIERISAKELLKIFETQGYSCVLSSDRTIVWTIDGLKTTVIRSSTGTRLMFRAAFGDGNATMKKVNDWNKKMQFSRSYLDDDGDPVLELDLDLDGGVTKKRIIDFFKTCRTSYLRWIREVIL